VVYQLPFYAQTHGQVKDILSAAIRGQNQSQKNQETA